MEWNKRTGTQSNILLCSSKNALGIRSSNCLTNKAAEANYELKRIGQNVPRINKLNILKNSITLLDINEDDTSDYICMIQLPADIPLSNHHQAHYEGKYISI